jgi:dolichol kinase
VGLILPAVYYFWGKGPALLAAGVFVGLFMAGESFRLHHAWFNERVLKTFSALAKDRERTRITGATYFMIGSALTIAIYAREVAILAIVFSVFGDMAATLVGARFGRLHVTPEKTLEGGLACFLACFLAGLGLLQTELPINLLQVFLGSMAAALIEIFSSPLDDNLTIPIFAGLLMQSVY